MPITDTTLDLNFETGTFPAEITFTRASTATYFDVAGTLQSAAVNVPRLDFDPALHNRLGFLIEGARTNSIRNPRAEGAVVADGIELVTNGNFALDPIHVNPGTVQNGWSWLTGGGTAVVSWSSGAVSLNGDGTNNANIRVSVTTVVGRGYVIRFDVTGNVTNMNVGPTAGSSAILTQNTAVATGQIVTFVATSTTTWIQWGRTSIGAAAVDNVSVKSSGVLPTNWAAAAAGLAVNVIGTGTENGIPYIDIQWTGTTAGTSANLYFESQNQIAAVNAQSWALSLYARIIGGSAANISAFSLSVRMNNSGSANLDALPIAFVPLGSTLNANRQGGAVTTNNASTAFVTPALTMTYASGAAINLTLRIGGPQLELGSFVTSLIFPVAGTPAASTRAVDVATVASGAWSAGSDGTIATDFTFANTTPAGMQTGIVRLDDGTETNRAIFFSGPGSTAVNAFSQITSAILNNGIGACAGLSVKAAMSWGGGLWCYMRDGYPPGQASGSTTFPFTRLILGSSSVTAGGHPLNGYLRRVRYWPRVLDNSELIDATTVYLDFSPGAFPPEITFTRASTATYFDATGTLQIAANNVPRIDHHPTSLVCRGFLTEMLTTNVIRNPRAEGATVGVIGAGGVLPTYWSIVDTTGLGSEVVGFGYEAGIPYVDLRFFGTASAGTVTVGHDTVSSANSRWAGTVFQSLVAGTVANILAFRVGVENYTAASAYIATVFGTAAMPTSAPLRTQRRVCQTVQIGATTAFAKLLTQLTVAAGSVDCTLRLGAPQMEIGRFHTSLVLPAVGVPGASSRAYDVASMPFVSPALAPLAMMIEATAPLATSSVPVFLTVDNGSMASSLFINNPFQMSAGSTTPSPGIGQSNAVTTVADGVAFKFAVTWTSGAGLIASMNSSVASSPLGTQAIGPMTTLRPGMNSNPATETGTWIRRARVWSRALSGAELQYATSTPRTISPASIPTSTAIGPATHSGLGAFPAGLLGAQAFGSPLAYVALHPAGIPATVAFGSPALLPQPVTLLPSGIPAATALLGAARAALLSYVTALGIPSTAQVGVPFVVVGAAPLFAASTVEDYLSLLSSWHSGRERFVATIRASVAPFVAAQAALSAMPRQFDLDIAIGAQLDVLGKWIGRSRQIAIPITGVYFSLDTESLGFDQGVWLGPYDAIEGLVSLDDETYRLLLRAKIAANTWDGTMEGAIAVLDPLASAAGTLFYLEDRQDMSFLLGMAGHIPDALYRALILAGHVTVKPAGVRVHYVATTVEGAPIFGFDVASAYINGFDIGAWGDSPPVIDAIAEPPEVSISDGVLSELTAGAGATASVGLLTFPETVEGDAADSQAVTITNTGDAPLTITAVAASGDYSVLSETSP